MWRGKTWREWFAPEIRAAVEQGEARGLTGKALETFVRNATRPGMSNGYWPVKAWRAEVKFQLGLSKLPPRAPKPKPPAPGQLLMPILDTP